MTPLDPCTQFRDRLLGQSWAGQRDALLLWLDGLADVHECIADLLQQSLASRDWASFERCILAAQRKPSRLYTPTLCEALSMRSEDVNSEDIVDALDAIADPASVRCLEDALEWDPPWDEYRQLAVKCVWALSAIDTDVARQALHRVAHDHESARVREAAAQKLGARRQ